ncbi:MAG: PIN domain-containing protein [Nanoarchaeota archaeon]
MKLVLDANILISALIKDSVTRKIIFISRIIFYIPDFTLDEVLRYKDYIREKSKLSKSKFNELLSLILKYIIVIPFPVYSKHIKEAEQIIGNIDEQDIPYIALALAIKADGIWSEDSDFKKQKKVKVLTTKELINYLRKN